MELIQGMFSAYTYNRYNSYSCSYFLLTLIIDIIVIVVVIIVI